MHFCPLSGLLGLFLSGSVNLHPSLVVNRLSFKLCFSGSSSGTGIFRMTVETFETCVLSPALHPGLKLKRVSVMGSTPGLFLEPGAPEERQGHCLVHTLTEGNHKVAVVHISGLTDAVGCCSPHHQPPIVCMAWSWGSCLLCQLRGCQPHESPPSPIMKATNEVALNSNRL